MKFGFVFPGQGSQHIGMLQEYIEQYAIVKHTLAEASSVLDLDLQQLYQHGPEELLNQTAITQPALLTASVAIWRVWLEQHGPLPALLAGHSLGEYSALVCAEAISLIDAVYLVHKRGQFMQAATPTNSGQMAAIIGLPITTVVQICCEASTATAQVSAANFNSPGQVVIAGHASAVQQACTMLKAAGAKRVLPLAVSVASHCALMQPAANELTSVLNEIEIHAPKIPVISNAAVHVTFDPDQIRQDLIAQLTRPVRWVETVEKLAKDGCQIIIECGAGKILTGLNKRIVENVNCLSINEPLQLLSAIELTREI